MNEPCASAKRLAESIYAAQPGDNEGWQRALQGARAHAARILHDAGLAECERLLREALDGLGMFTRAGGQEIVAVDAARVRLALAALTGEQP